MSMIKYVPVDELADLPGLQLSQVVWFSITVIGDFVGASVYLGGMSANVEKTLDQRCSATFDEEDIQQVLEMEDLFKNEQTGGKYAKLEISTPESTVLVEHEEFWTDYEA